MTDTRSAQTVHKDPECRDSTRTNARVPRSVISTQARSP